MTTVDMSAIGLARIYTHKKLNEVQFAEYDNNTVTNRLVTQPEPTCLEIPSNIALHPTSDLMAYSCIIDSSVVGSSFRGKVLFRDRNFVSKFDFVTDRHFDFGTFNPANTDKLIVLFAGATICIVDYNLGGSTGTLGNCKKTYGL